MLDSDERFPKQSEPIEDSDPASRRDLAAGEARTRRERGEFDAVVIGAGFAGLYMLVKLRQLGLRAIVLEKGADVGGTWYWNRYPGARCDVESLNYQYSFSDEIQQGWSWTERYATQPEILRYLQFVADRLDLRREIELGTTVTSAVWEDASGRWIVRTDRGDRFTARFCISAVGSLSLPKMPEVEGLESFAGPWYHTALWPHDGVDLTGKRVAVIGTGSSGVQTIPMIAREARTLTVFQRTANYVVPAQNRPLTPRQLADDKDRFQVRRREAEMLGGALDRGANLDRAMDLDPAQRERRYEEAWAKGGLSFMAAFRDLLTSQAANDTAADYVRRRIRERVVDPAVAEALTPTDHPFASKRLCVDIDYFETFNRDNVSLIDLRASPIDRIVPTGVRMADGRELPFDVLVFATGFDAVTGALLAIDIQGRRGQTLREAWRDGPVSYLGLMVAGFPNLFTITGPGSPSVLSNVVVSIEQHVDWIGDLLRHMDQRGASCVDAEPEAERRWVEHVAEVAGRTLYPLARSWFAGANVPGKPRVFMPYVAGVGPYRTICDEVAASGYRGFRFDR
jgi:cyclohexanone monooxygenase